MGGFGHNHGFGPAVAEGLGVRLSLQERLQMRLVLLFPPYAC